MFDFEELMKKFYDEIFFYVYNQLDDLEEAKDLTQDIFLKIFKKQNNYQPNKASIRTWLYRIAHNQCMDYFKSSYYKSKKKSIAIDYDIKNNDDILEYVIKEEKAQHIIQLMNTILNKKHKKMMNLYFFSELTVEEISLVLEIPKKTVYNTINETIKKIKERMERHDELS